MEQRKNNKGFSLVELIVVIAIITALVAVVSMSSGLINRSYAKSATQDIVSMLTRCRAETLGGLNCYVQMNASYVALCNSDGSEIDHKDFAKKVTLSKTKKTSLQVSFNPNTGGRVKGSSYYTVTLGTVVYKISINSLTGAVTVT